MTDGKSFKGRKRFVMAGATLLAAIGAMGAGHAEPVTEIAMSSVVASEDLTPRPTFTPSDEAVFEDAFDHLAAPLPDAELPAHAVDITAIEPPIEAAPAERATSLGRGIASFYGKAFAGRPTASGEAFDPYGYTAAHKTLPFGSRVRVTNTANGRSVVVRINDRGPFVKGRHIDLSRRAAEDIGIVSMGHGSVEIELIT